MNKIYLKVKQEQSKELDKLALENVHLLQKKIIELEHINYSQQKTIKKLKEELNRRKEQALEANINIDNFIMSIDDLKKHLNIVMNEFMKERKNNLASQHYFKSIMNKINDWDNYEV